jgi:hypothetical protein
MIERGVNHTIRHSRSTAQAFEVVKITSMHLSACGGKRVGGRIRTSKAEYLMARAD